MEIFVTGAAGFIGFHLCKRLLENDFSVTGLDNLNSYYDVNLKRSRLEELNKIRIKNNTKFVFVKGSINDEILLEKIFSENQFSIVINMAAQAGVRYSIESPKEYIDTNLKGFANLLECCRNKKIQHLIYASSSSVYGGNTEIPFSEDHNVNHPVSLYAATKKSNELMAHTYSHLYNLPTTGLRFFTVYGPWGRPDMALFKFTKNIILGKPIQVFNYGKHKRDFTFIDDITEALIRIIYKPAERDPNWDSYNPDPGSSNAPWRIYNIGNNKPINLMDYIKAIEESLNKKAIINLMPLQPGDVEMTYADVEDLIKDFDYKPTTDIKVGIEKFVSWYKEFYKISF